MKNYISIAIATLLINNISCKSEKCTTLVADIYMQIKNENGIDLLNPQSLESIRYEDTELYYIINDVKVRQLNANLDIPKNFIIQSDSYQNERIYFLKAFLNMNVSNNEISTTIIEYKDYPSDTITAKIKKTACFTGYTDAWINGKLIDTKKNPIQLIK